MMRSKLSARAWCVAIMCSVLVITASGTAAGATGTTSRTGAVTGTATFLQPDGSCAPNPEFPTDPGYRENITGRTTTRFGPAKIKVDVCYIFVGAIGGQSLHGSFSIATFAGTLRGTADGGIGYGNPDHYSLTLSVERGTWFLANVRGTLQLEVDEPRDVPGIVGTLTSDLHRVWGHWHHPTPFPFT